MAKLVKAREPALPAESDRARQRIYVTLDPVAVAIARKIGNNVVSRGIDRALFHFDNHPPKRSKAHE